MTISTTDNKRTYNGNSSTTVFAFNIMFFQKSDISVYKRVGITETLLIEGVDYSISGTLVDGIYKNGANITITPAPATGTIIVATRNIPLTQNTSYVENDTFPSSAHEQALDKLTIITQQLQNSLSLAVSAPITSTIENLTFPIQEAGKLIGWNSTATALENKEGSQNSALPSFAGNQNRSLTLNSTATALTWQSLNQNIPTAIFDLLVGLMLPDAGPTILSGLRVLPCDGRLVSRTTYAKLFARIGITYGAGDGSTTFALPDRRGRVGVGLDGSADRLTSASVGGTNSNTLGGTGGSETHTLLQNEMPVHTHGFTDFVGSSQFSAPNGTGQDGYKISQTQPAGGDQPHSNTQPWIAFNYVIFY
jgi:microcystin-dependent protein